LRGLDFFFGLRLTGLRAIGRLYRDALDRVRVTHKMSPPMAPRPTIPAVIGKIGMEPLEVDAELLDPLDPVALEFEPLELVVPELVFDPPEVVGVEVAVEPCWAVELGELASGLVIAFVCTSSTAEADV